MHPDRDSQGPRYPQRRHLQRLERLTTPAPPLFFLTCCSDGRRPLLANPTAAAILIDAWREVQAPCGWLIGRYVIMPDHVHFFAGAQGDGAKPLSLLLGSFKRRTSRGLRKHWPEFRWQPEFFDRLSRNSESYEQKWEYVRGNPVRVKLVDRAEDWPYQGELNLLQW